MPGYLRCILTQITQPAGRSGRSRKKRGSISISGDYQSWHEAVKDSAGYDARDILAKVRDSALKAKRTEAAFERDSVDFDVLRQIQLTGPPTTNIDTW